LEIIRTAVANIFQSIEIPEVYKSVVFLAFLQLKLHGIITQQNTTAKLIFRTPY